MNIPLRSIRLPEGVGLAIRETCVAIRGQVSAPRETGFALRDEKRPRRWDTTCRQILVQQCADGAREKHFAGLVAFALDENGAIRPGNMLNVDSQGFLATQTAIIDQPEEGMVAWVAVSGTRSAGSFISPRI